MTNVVPSSKFVLKTLVEALWRCYGGVDSAPLANLLLILTIQDSFGQTGQTILHSTAMQRILHACHEVFPACHASLRAWCGIRGSVKRYGQV